MRPIFDGDPPRNVVTDFGVIPWDAQSNQPVDVGYQAGRLYARALADHGMTVPDPYVPPEAPPVSFTPPQIIAALKSWGVADAVITATPKVDLAEFYTATAIRETEPRLTAMLGSIGKTMSDLKAQIT